MSLFDAKEAWKSVLNGGTLKQILRVFLHGSDGGEIGTVDGRLKVESTTEPSEFIKRTALDMVRASGISEGESYDEIDIAQITSSQIVGEFQLGGVCQFQIEINENSMGFSLKKRACEFFLLQENGDKLLQENGDALLAQGLIP